MATTTEQVGRQNTRDLTAGQEAVYQATGPLGGGVFSWDLMNFGPGDIWMRWDGQDAAADDDASLWLPAGAGYQQAVTSRMSVLSVSNTTISFVVNDRS